MMRELWKNNFRLLLLRVVAALLDNIQKPAKINC